MDNIYTLLSCVTYLIAHILKMWDIYTKNLTILMNKYPHGLDEVAIDLKKKNVHTTYHKRVKTNNIYYVRQYL